MSKQYYDDFSKLPLAKMAQAISDMTYLFEETKVPAKHYKEHLARVLKKWLRLVLVFP